MATEDVNVFDTTEDVGAILPPRIDAPGPLASYFTRPMVPSPASRRRDTLKGIAQFIPFLSGEIAKYDDDKLGMALSSLDALGPAGTAVKGTLAIGKQAAKKGVGSLDDKNTINLVHGTTADVAKQIEEIGEIQPKLGSYVEDMYITRGDYADVPPSDYPPLASFFSTADDPSSAIGAMKAQIGYKLGKELNDPISLDEIKKHGAVVLSDANPRTIFKMDENYRPYNLMDEPASIDEPLGFESEDIVSLIPQKPKKVLTGDDLVEYVKKNDPEFAGVGSLDQPKDMMFVHNTNESAIKSFDQMGGIPSPSLAVQPADVPLKGFGQIQLIAKPKNFDPAVDPRNAVYSADAYTPRAPKKIRLAKEGAPQQFSKDYKELAEKYGFDLDRDLFEQGENALLNLQKNNLYYPENRIDEFDRFFDSDVARLKYLETKVGNLDDWFALPVAERSKKLPNKALYSSDFYKWARKEKDKYLSQEGVFQYFDDFEQTMVTKPYTLENATENMIKETQRGGEGGIGTFGPNRLRALMAEKFVDLPDIKARRDMITPDEVHSDLVDDVHFTLQDALQDDMGVTEDVLRGVADQLQAGKKNIDDIVRIEIQDLDWESPKQLDDAVSEVANTIRLNSMRPVEYFEAKPMRSVGFEEFAGAIVPPRTSQEVIDILEKRGLKVIKNDPETDFMKTKARQKFKDQMFSFAPVAGAGGIAALTIEDNTPDNDKGVGSIKN